MSARNSKYGNRLLNRSRKFSGLFLFLWISIATIGQDSPDIKSSVEIYRSSTTKREKMNALSNLIVDYTNYNMDSALIWMDTMKTLMLNEKRPVFLSRYYSVTGYVYERLGNYDLALKNQKLCLKYALKTKNTSMISNAYNGVGVMYDLLGDYNQALKNYFKGYEIRKKEKDEYGMQQSLSNIGLVYHLKGDFQNALKYLYQSLELAEKDKTTAGYTSALNNLALVFQQQKNYDRALKFYNDCLKIYLKNNSKYDVALAYNNIGTIYLDKKELRKALSYHMKSLQLKDEIHDMQGKVMSCQNIGLIYKELQILDSALVYLLEGRAILDSLPDPASEIEMNATMGSVYFAKKEYAKALEYFNRSVAIYNSGIQYYKIFETYKNLSNIHLVLGNYKEAYDYNELYWIKHDSLQNNENLKLLQQKEIEGDYLRKKREDELIRKKEEEKRDLEDKAEEKQRFIWSVFFGSVILGLLIFVLIIYRNYNEKKKANGLLSERNNIISIQNTEIRKQSILLEEKNRDITDSIQYAKRLQDAILPDPAEREKLMKDHFILYRPKDIVSGDFYWLHDLSENGKNKYLFGVVDCTGHGVPGGFVSIVGNNALNRAVNEFRLQKPADILNKVSELVEESFDSDNGEIRDGMDMSLIAVESNGDIATVDFAGANNPVWIVKKGTSEIIELKADKQPIGKYEFRKPFSSHRLELEKGDCIYLFSDGYADQFGGPSGKKFKYSQLKEKLVSMHRLEMYVQEKNLNDAILQWRGELEQIDDICIAGIKI